MRRGRGRDRGPRGFVKQVTVMPLSAPGIQTLPAITSRHQRSRTFLYHSTYRDIILARAQYKYSGARARIFVYNASLLTIVRANAHTLAGGTKEKHNALE